MNAVKIIIIATKVVWLLDCSALVRRVEQQHRRLRSARPICADRKAEHLTTATIAGYYI